MKLEYPLNEALPNTDHARDRLLAKIFRFRKEEKDEIGATDVDFELLYAYGAPRSSMLSYKTCNCACLPVNSTRHGPALQRYHRGRQGDREALWCAGRGDAEDAIMRIS